MPAALSRDRDTERIFFEENRCIGCWMCVMVCPHNAIVRDKKAGKVILCDQCAGREIPACVVVCSTSAIQYVDVEE